MSKSQTMFQRWIESVGDERAQKILNVKKLRTVQSWRLGERLPRSKKMSRIAKLSGVPVSGIVS